MLYSVQQIIGEVFRKLFGPAQSSRFDFTITNDDLEDLQAGYQPKTNMQYGMVHKGDWCKYLRDGFEAAVNN